MAHPGIHQWCHRLQDWISPSDQVWAFTVPDLPKPSSTNPRRLLKSIVLTSNDSKQHIGIRLIKASPNRAMAHEPLDRFISISFEHFRLYYPTRNDSEGPNLQHHAQFPQRAPPKESADYILRFLRSGVILNDIQYNFYGHSNSNLQTKTCILLAGSKDEISAKIEGLGDFSKIKTVAKKAKRIGLLFSTANMAVELATERCEDIPDVASKDYIFTDGCGLISPHLAGLLIKHSDIKFRNRRYSPSVFQIRYRGYKGVLMLEPTLKGQILVKFRNSMKKFEVGNDRSFSVVNYSKPYSFGYLNDEVILLLHSLGIPELVLLRKQQEHLEFLSSALTSPQNAFRLLTYYNHLDLAERVLTEGIESTSASVGRVIKQEYEKMINKRDQQRCRIMIPRSRLLLGVCDSKDVLREGECFVKVTLEADGQPRQLSGMEILVTRNPCLHPGDLQKFKAVARPELAHLVDCIVFPTRGRRPSADLMSGGDLDGDTFLVCWDADLVPSRLSEPAHYQGAKEPISFKPISDDDRLVYFARYTNASLGRVKNLYLDWARVAGAMSSQCQELNHLFSKCVDGNHIKVPKHLENPPQPPSDGPRFILDVLHDAATRVIKNQQKQTLDLSGYSYSAIQLLMSRDDVAMSEFELLKLTHRWCESNNTSLAAFLDLFDFNQLNDEEKAWVVFQLPQSIQIPSLIMNATVQSNLVTMSELKPFRLHYSGIHWKRIFDSTVDRMGCFLSALSQAIELYHRKLVVLRIDTRLTIAIYIPKQIEKRTECQVDNTVRLFAFPHTQGDESFQRRVVPTKMKYRLYCDDNTFQLYEGTRANTWVFLARPGSDDTAYRNEPNQGNQRRARQSTIDQGQNHDCVASIAMDKYSRGLQRHVGRVNRTGVLDAEIYVISNRDIRSLRVLDLWLDFIDTEETIPLFEKAAREYSLPTLSAVDWAMVPDHIRMIARDGDLSPFKTWSTTDPFVQTLDWLLENNERGLLRRCFELQLELILSESIQSNGSDLLQALLNFLSQAPLLSISFVKLGDWRCLKPGLRSIMMNRARDVLEGIILATNTMQNLVIAPFRRILSYLAHMSLEDVGRLIEKMCLTVRDPEVALDLLGSLETESSRLLVGRPKNVQHYLRNLIGIALDSIDEAYQSQKPRDELLSLKKAQEEGIVWSTPRIDVPTTGAFRLHDHVRLTAASRPSNDSATQPYSMDALVQNSEQGRVEFRCLHPLPVFLEECSWRVVNCGSFVTGQTMLDALYLFASEAETQCALHDLLLGLPDTLLQSTLCAQPYSARPDLNRSQNQAIQVSLTRALTCWWGPPGTGKTHTIVALLQELLQDVEERRVLVTAPTHNAVDNVLRKYVHEMSKRQTISTEPVRVTTDVRKVAEDLRNYTCDAMVGQEVNESFGARRKAQTRVKNSRLIFTTCIGAGLGLLRKEKFDTVIVDEASQQTEPASLVPLVKGCTKAILVGDHLQLRATVQQYAAVHEFDVSLFERLYTETAEVQKVMLDSQYRMHSEICSFSSREFYESNLLTAIDDETRPIPSSGFPWPISPSHPNEKARMIFVQCSATEDLGRKSKSNKGQAALCQEICKQLMHRSPSDKEPGAKTPGSIPPIAILTPYTAQAELLTRMIPSTVPIFSIDGFQGREADIIIFVTVRCNLGYEIGFLKDLRRLNVVMTRARAGCIVIGDRSTLTMGSVEEESTMVWRRLLESLTPVEIALA